MVNLIEDIAQAQYRVNFKETDRYIATLQSSGFFSDNFLNSQSRFFKESDSRLMKEKQSDGPPVGFEADLLLFTLEPESVLGKISSLKLEIIKPDRIRLRSNNLIFKTEIQSGQCLFKEIIFDRGS